MLQSIFRGKRHCRPSGAGLYGAAYQSPEHTASAVAQPQPHPQPQNAAEAVHTTDGDSTVVYGPAEARVCPDAAPVDCAGGGREPHAEEKPRDVMACLGMQREPVHCLCPSQVQADGMRADQQDRPPPGPTTTPGAGADGPRAPPPAITHCLQAGAEAVSATGAGAVLRAWRQATRCRRAWQPRAHAPAPLWCLVHGSRMQRYPPSPTQPAKPLTHTAPLLQANSMYTACLRHASPPPFLSTANTLPLVLHAGPCPPSPSSLSRAFPLLLAGPCHPQSFKSPPLPRHTHHYCPVTAPCSPFHSSLSSRLSAKSLAPRAHASSSVVPPTTRRLRRLSARPGPHDMLTSSRTPRWPRAFKHVPRPVAPRSTIPSGKARVPLAAVVARP